MNRNFCRSLQIPASLFFAVIFLALPAPAQNDPDPNSPAPVLVAAPDSTYALAMESQAGRTRGLPSVSEASSAAFDRNARTVLFVKNVQLMKGEGANAFRVYAEDSRRRLYRFPVLDVEPLYQRNGTYAVTVELRDDLNFSDVPPAGELLVSIAWRGLESNKLI